MALNFGELLGGIGAAMGGTAPQYVQDLKSRKQAELVAREKAMYQDAAIGLQLLESGQLHKLDMLGRDRMDQLRQFPDAVPNDTLRMLALNKLAMGGDRAALGQLHAELISANRAGQVKGYLSAPAAPEGYTLSQGQTRFEGGRNVASVPASAPVSTQTSKQKEANDVALKTGVAGSPEYEKAYMEYMNRTSGGTTINTGAEGNYGLPKSVIDQFSSLLDAASVSASSVPQLASLEELSNYTTEGRLGEFYTKLFPSVNEANTTFIGLVNQVLPSMRTAGSGAQSDKDIDVLINSIGNLTYSNEVKKFLVQSLQEKNKINQELADISEQLFSNEISGSEAIKKRREINSRTIISAGLRTQLAKITGSNKLPSLAAENGVTQDEFNSMTPEQQDAFR